MHGRKPRPHKVFPSSNNNYTRQNAELSIFVLFGSNHRRVCRCYVYIPIRSFSCINTDDVCSTTTTTKRTRRVSLYVTMPSRFILLKPIITRSITTICYFAVILLSIVYLVLYNRCSPVHWMAIFVRYNKLSKFVLRLFYSPHYWLILHYTTIMTSFSGCCCYCCCCRYWSEATSRLGCDSSTNTDVQRIKKTRKRFINCLFNYSCSLLWFIFHYYMLVCLLFMCYMQPI